MKNTRNKNIDLVKAIAITLVVFIHSLDSVFQAQLLTDKAWRIYQVFRIIGREGVPLFLLATGFLVLERAKDIPILTYYTKRLPKFVLLTIFYCLFTNIVTGFINNQGINWFEILSGMLYGQTGSAYQLWYMYVFIGLSITIPFLSRLLTTLNKKELLLLIFLNFLFVYTPQLSYALFRVDILLGHFNIEMFGGYTLYLFIGYFFSKYKINHNKIIVPLCYLLVIYITLRIQIHIDKHDLLNLNKGEGFLWYSSSAATLIGGALLFHMLLSINLVKRKTLSKLSLLISKNSFGIFLFHLIPLSLIYHFFLKEMVDTSYISVTLLCFSSFLTSLLIVNFASKNKFSRAFIS